MKFEMQELIFAERVRDLATLIRAEAALTEKLELEKDMPEDKKESMRDFANRHAIDHPATEYVPAAMDRIRDTALVIQEYLKTQD